MLFSIRSTLLVVLLCSWHTVPENSWNWTSAYAMFFREINLQKRCGNFHDFFVNSILRDYYFALFHDFFRQINFIGTLVFFSWNRILRHILSSYFFEKFRMNSDHEHSARFFETKKKDESSVKPPAYSKVPSEFCCTYYKNTFGF